MNWIEASKTDEPRDIIRAFRELPEPDQRRIIQELQDVIDQRGNRPETPIQPQTPPGTPEDYREVIADLHRLAWYSVERGVRAILRRVLPDIVSALVRREIKAILREKR